MGSLIPLFAHPYHLLLGIKSNHAITPPVMDFGLHTCVMRIYTCVMDYKSEKTTL
jgi:hypothetical protein